MKTIVLGRVVGLLVGLGLSSCTPMPSVVLAPPSVEKALYGKTEKELLACAAVRPSEQSGPGKTGLLFYKEASLLDESFPGTKSSAPNVHHGCLAHVELQDDRIQQIHYHAVPETYPGYDHCDEIFEPCLGD
jgi:hypothetical protein